MSDVIMEKLKYPIGHFSFNDDYTEANIKNWIADLENLPTRLEKLVLSLDESQLETPYRPEGWTVRQLIHHIADSHHHSYTRFKWALTEDKPVIKAYEEKDWAIQLDGRTAPIQLSLDYLKALHAKMVFMLKGLSKEQLLRCYVHPENNAEVTVVENIAKYAWHGNHHYAHIYELCKRKEWL